MSESDVFAIPVYPARGIAAADCNPNATPAAPVSPAITSVVKVFLSMGFPSAIICGYLAKYPLMGSENGDY